MTFSYCIGMYAMLCIGFFLWLFIYLCCSQVWVLRCRFYFYFMFAECWLCMVAMPTFRLAFLRTVSYHGHATQSVVCRLIRLKHPQMGGVVFRNIVQGRPLLPVSRVLRAWWCTHDLSCFRQPLCFASGSLLIHIYAHKHNHAHMLLYIHTFSFVHGLISWPNRAR